MQIYTWISVTQIPEIEKKHNCYMAINVLTVTVSSKSSATKTDVWIKLYHSSNKKKLKH